MELDVVEIAPPPVSSRPSKLLKRKEVILHEVIDVDEGDSADTVGYGMKIDARNKGKAVKSISNSYLNYQSKDCYSNNSFGPGGAGAVSVNGLEYPQSSAPGLHSINLGSHGSDSFHETDKYIDLSANDVINVDDYEILQAQFDNVDIPTGVEAPLPWLQDLAQVKSKAPIDHSAKCKSQMQSNHGSTLHMISPCPSIRPTGTSQFYMKPASADAVINPYGVELPSPQLYKPAGHGKCRVATSKPKHQFAGESFQSSQLMEPSFCPNSSSTAVNQVHAAINPVHVAEFPAWMQCFPNHLKKQRGSKLPHSGISSRSGPLNHPSGGVHWSEAHQYGHAFKMTSFFTSHQGVHHPFDGLPIAPEGEADSVWNQEYSGNQNKIYGGGSIADSGKNSHGGKDGNLEDVLRKFRSFKQFDTVEDHSDHYYAQNGYSMKQPSKVWAKRIQEDWKILEKDLPDTIFVRVYESRMDILRAVIKGAEGTPYHDGLFFFDVFFPSDYPNKPPWVYYHAGGLRLNPNLYACGKVCLSLLNTWSGSKNEKWIPGKSSMLQVLVSIQGLILNSNPYFNEPGYERMSGTPQGEKCSLKYNEDTFILSLRTMSYTMRKPPKHFEDLVTGHFCEHAHDILVACKAYIDGAQVGCLVKGGVQDVDEGDKSCSDDFKTNVANYLRVLVTDFKNIGAKDCEKFLPPTETTSKLAGAKAAKLNLGLNFWT